MRNNCIFYCGSIKLMKFDQIEKAVDVLKVVVNHFSLTDVELKVSEDKKVVFNASTSDGSLRTTYKIVIK